MKYPKRSQYKYAKSRYRVRNWAEYEAGLQKRGDVIVWLSDDALDSWRAPPSGKPGGQRTYADIAIEAALTIRMVFHLPLRQTEGFLRCLAELLEIDLPIPDHTTLSRRLKSLRVSGFRLPTDRPLHLLIDSDSTGLRIHVGHMQKPPRNRAWRKLHIAVCAFRPSGRASSEQAEGSVRSKWHGIGAKRRWGELVGSRVGLGRGVGLVSSH